MNLIEGIKAAFSLLSSIFIVILICSLGIFATKKNPLIHRKKIIIFSSLSLFAGWFLVYKFFLLRFKVVRELLGQLHPSEKSEDTKVNSKNRQKIRRD